MPAFFVIFVVIISAILFGMHGSVYRGLISIFSITNTSAILFLKIIFILLPISFILSFFIISRYNNLFTKLAYTLSASWIGFLFFLFLAVIIFYIIKLAFGAGVNSSYILLAGKLLVLMAILTGIYGIYNARNLVVSEATISLPNLPESWRGKRAVLYADVHLGQIQTEKFAERVSKKIQSLKPDILFNVGDLYDGVKVNETAIIEPFKNLEAPLGHFFVMGNHEEFRNNRAFADAIRGANMKILDNEIVRVDGMQIIGVDYEKTTNKEAFADILKNIEINPDQPSILLKHAPFNLDVAEKRGISLQLSGHTHRAQVFPLSFLTKLIYKGYDYGLKEFGSMQVLVTSGAGTWGPPLRVGTKSEIFLIIFK